MFLDHVRSPRNITTSGQEAEEHKVDQVGPYVHRPFHPFFHSSPLSPLFCACCLLHMHWPPRLSAPHASATPAAPGQPRPTLPRPSPPCLGRALALPRSVAHTGHRPRSDQQRASAARPGPALPRSCPARPRAPVVSPALPSSA
jgi:hypothetical protein